MVFDPSKLERILRLTPVKLCEDDWRGCLEFQHSAESIQPGKGVLYVQEESSHLRVFDEQSPLPPPAHAGSGSRAYALPTIALARDDQESDDPELGEVRVRDVDDSGTLHLIYGKGEVIRVRGSEIVGRQSMPGTVYSISGAAEDASYVLVGGSNIWYLQGDQRSPFVDVEELVQDILFADGKLQVMLESGVLLSYDTTAGDRTKMPEPERMDLTSRDRGPFAEDDDWYCLLRGTNGAFCVKSDTTLAVIRHDEEGPIVRDYTFGEDIEDVVMTNDGKILALVGDSLWHCEEDDEHNPRMRALRLCDVIGDEAKAMRVYELALSRTHPSRLYLRAGSSEVFAFDMHWDYAVDAEALGKLVEGQKDQGEEIEFT